MRAEKQFILDDITEKIANSKALVITRYRGLDPNIASNFRNELAKSGAAFTAVRKRILMKAAEKEGISLSRDMLPGHIGLVFTNEDPIIATKAIFQFDQKNEEKLFEVLGGRFEGVFYSSADVKAISVLPAKDEMRAQFLGILEAPMTQTLSVMESMLASIIHCFANKAEKEKD
ncbi:MAG: 50S ribosomal protein L10 [Chlamydiae bacterium]|nr:50S ribosomal protein L10 [Chlamydiota bacterium]